MNDSRSPRAAVIGSGRCGTGYIAELFTRSGLDAGHERWWNAGLGQRRHGLDVDVSWLALPELETEQWSGPTIHLIRNPLDTVRSLVRTKFFHPVSAQAPFPRFARKHCPAAAEHARPVEAAVAWWLDWNARCAAVADATVRVEDLTNPVTLKVVTGVLERAIPSVGLEWSVAEGIPKNTNHTPRGMRKPPVAEPEQVSAAKVWDLLRGRDTFGYRDES